MRIYKGRHEPREGESQDRMVPRRGEKYEGRRNPCVTKESREKRKNHERTKMSIRTGKSEVG